jgi:hypothetical protein
MKEALIVTGYATFMAALCVAMYAVILLKW